MRDVDEGAPEFCVQPIAFRAQLAPQLGVETGQRLIQQEGGRVRHEGPRERDALGFTARTLARHLVKEMRDVHHLRHLAHALDPLLRRHFLHPQAELDVLRHILVRKKSVALEHHAEAAVARLEIVDHAPVDADFARSRVLETGNHAQRRRLAAAGGTDEDDELAVFDVEGQIFHRLHRTERFVQIQQLDARHRYLRTIPKLNPRARCFRMMRPTIINGMVMPTASAACRP